MKKIELTEEEIDFLIKLIEDAIIEAEHEEVEILYSILDKLEDK